MTTAPRFAPILAAAGVFIVAQQLADLTPALTAADIPIPESRLQLLVGIASRGPTLIAADVLLIWAMLSLAHRGGMRALGVLHLALGVLALLAAPLLMQDAGNVVDQVGAGIANYRAVVLRTLLFLLTFGVGGLLTGRALRSL